MPALTLAQGVSLVGDTTFRLRVAMAFYFVARNVLSEGGGVTGHEQRERFARGILQQTYEQFLQYSALVVTDPVIVAAGPSTQSAISDQQIVTAVNGMWNTLAGIDS